MFHSQTDDQCIHRIGKIKRPSFLYRIWQWFKAKGPILKCCGKGILRNKSNKMMMEERVTSFTNKYFQNHKELEGELNQSTSQQITQFQRWSLKCQNWERKNSWSQWITAYPSKRLLAGRFFNQIKWFDSIHHHFAGLYIYESPK